jgi:hypothetical protein
MENLVASSRRRVSQLNLRNLRNLRTPSSSPHRRVIMPATPVSEAIMTTTQKPPINTSKAHRRKIHFDTIDQAIAEAERIANLELNGTIQYSGNWTAGQILNHCGGWAEYVYKPNPLKAPWPIRFVMKFLKNRFLNHGLPSGRNIPKVEGGTLIVEPVDVRQALGRFKEAYSRLKREPPTHPSPVFGTMTQEEAIKLNLRHAELHLSFVLN